jgi:DNA-binding transcriptional ArsR family regulator
VLRLQFEIEDLAAVRFAISPVTETVGALQWLGDPQAAGPHRPWVKALRGAERDESLGVVLDLLPARGYVPDFLTPPATPPLGDLDAELAAIRATPPDVVRHEIDLVFNGRAPTARAVALRAEPEAGLAALVDALRRWHAAAIAPHWERVRALLAAEVALQSRYLSEGGAGLALANLHPAIRWQPGALDVEMRWEKTLPLAGRGLLLVPSAFWPGIGPIVLGAWQPTLLYPARGLELLWEGEPEVPDALAGVVGVTRARLLAELEEPATTAALARRLELAAPGVSQHLQRLRGAGLVSASRDGREVLYRRTALAVELVRGATAGSRP